MTIRLDIGGHHSHADMALPSSSTFNELLPELAVLLELPESDQPWEFASVAGAVFDADTPLHSHGIRDGQIVVLHPKTSSAPPVVRDAAESLVARAHSLAETRGLDTVASVIGIAACTIVAASFMAVPFALAGAAIVATLLAVFTRRQAFSVGAILAGGAAPGLWVASASDSPTSLGMGLLVAIGSSSVLLFGARIANMVSSRVTATLSAVFLVIGSGVVGLWLPGDAAPAAVSILIALLLVMVAPGLGTRLSGLKIPRVPTAGEELPDATDHQPDVDERAEAAKLIADGLLLGTSLGLLPALVLLAHTGGVWEWALLMCTAGALAVHGSRHHFPIPRVALTATVLLALVAASVAITTSDAHPVFIALTLVITAIPITSPLWSKYVSELEPTTVVWFERAEQAAIIAVIPLAMQAAGLFVLIRGLG
ncbi:type VII secretion integral membrane protein EccD [Corynebacterium lubricantis]|uniref:type VII secretion integral membrane protein EccD n=1 Tax=Corynebacterium lubricantis TaxID=541095 RepID=UPI001461327C|nr:type VII secretion integral membrane protein EccD [Corynebacterium lubricantis]